MKGKKLVILAVTVIVLCICGICYYFVDFGRNDKILNKKKRIISGTVYADYKNNEIPKDKIKSIRNADQIFAVNGNNILFGVDNAVKNYDVKTGKRNAVKYIDKNGTMVYVCSDGKIIVWIQEEIPEDNAKPSYQSLYYCKIGSEKNVFVDKSIVKVNKDNNAVCAEYSLLNFIKIEDNKIIYAAVDVKKASVEYKAFDINTGKKSTLYVDTVQNKDDKYKVSFPMNFAMDLKKGYIITNITNVNIKDNTSTYSLVLYNLKDKSKKILANSKDEFSTSIQYPNVAFSLKSEIHVYNIEKNKDDFIIKCNGHAKNVDIKGSYVSWNENRIYVYSMNDDKTYMINNGWFKGSRPDEGQKKITGNMIYWSDYGKLSYIKMDDK